MGPGSKIGPAGVVSGAQGARGGGAAYANAPTPVMSRPTISVWIVSVPS
jgi:hypothetical protein